MKLSLLPLLLLALCGPLYAAPLSEGEQQQASRLFTALGCRACHNIDKSGSNLATSLDRIGLKLSKEEILQRLLLPPGKLPRGEKFMPSYQTTSIKQLGLLSRFLANRK